MGILQNMKYRKESVIYKKYDKIYSKALRMGNWEDVCEKEMSKIFKGYEKYFASGKAPYSDEYAFEDFKRYAKENVTPFSGEGLYEFEVEKDYYIHRFYTLDMDTVISNLPRKRKYEDFVYTCRGDKLRDKVILGNDYSYSDFIKEVDTQLELDLKELPLLKDRVKKEIDTYFQTEEVRKLVNDQWNHPTDYSQTEDYLKEKILGKIEIALNLEEDEILYEGLIRVDDVSLRELVKKHYRWVIITNYIEVRSRSFKRKDFEYGNPQGFISFVCNRLKEFPEEDGVMWEVYMDKLLNDLKTEYQEKVKEDRHFYEILD